MLSTVIVGLSLLNPARGLSAGAPPACVIECSNGCEVLSKTPGPRGLELKVLHREHRGLFGWLTDRYRNQKHQTVFAALMRLQKDGQCAPPNAARAREASCDIEAFPSTVLGSTRYALILRGALGDSVVRSADTRGRAQRQGKLLVRLGQCAQKFDEN